MNSEFLLEVNNISKWNYGLAGAKQLILDDICFKIKNSYNSGNIISVLAPNNLSKTALLKIISSIEKPSQGKINLLGKNYDKPTGEIVFIPEKPSSFPWMNVKQNIQFSIEIKNDNQNIQEKINDLISLVGIEGYEDHFPNDKSLGFRFRISFARALAVNPKIILLDEPFLYLHGETRKEIISLVKNLTEQLHLTILFTSTNINDSISTSNKVIVMNSHPGRIIGEFEIDRNQNLELHSDYFNSIKSSIEKSYK